MHNLIQDLRYAARTLRRNLGFAAVAILALALGVGANTAVFTVVNGVLLRPLPFEQPARLFLISYVSQSAPFGPKPGLSDRHYLEFRRYDRLFERVATFAFGPVNLTGAGEAIRIRGASVTPDFPAVLRVAPALGRAFLDEEDQPGRDRVVLLSDTLWRGRFNADPHLIGQTIALDGVAHTVIGIMPPGFTFPYDAELWRPLGVRLDPHNSTTRPVVGRLKPGVSQQQAQAELEAFVAGLPRAPGEDRADFVARVLPLKEMLVGDIRKSLLIFSGAVGFVLLIACANVANLLLMRAASRQQEIAVRTALGAGRGRLVRQLLTESTLISVAGGAAGVLLAAWTVPALLALAPGRSIPRMQEIHIDAWVLGFTFGLSLLTGIAFGFAPALRATRRELRESLSQGARAVTARHEGFRSALVISEIALALVLLSGAALMLKSFLRIRSVDPGFRPEKVLTLTVDLPSSVYRTSAQVQAFYERALAKLAAVPGVAAAGAVNWIPFGQVLMKGTFQLEGGRQRPRGFIVDKPSVSPRYFRAVGIRLLSGRDFSDRDTAGAPGVIIVSESVARRLWPGESPLGKRIAMDDHPQPKDWLTIVGVVRDIRQQHLTKDPNPAIYQPYTQISNPRFLQHMTFVLRTTSGPHAAISAMRGALREMDSSLPTQSVATLDDLISATTAEPLFQARLLTVFSVLALILSSIGIYGVVAYSVTERTHEIGIRMALGAQMGDVMRIILGRTLALAAAGVALGLAGALAVTRVLAKFLFEVKPTDPATLITVAALLVAVALLAGLVPARRAAHVDPATALRNE